MLKHTTPNSSPHHSNSNLHQIPDHPLFEVYAQFCQFGVTKMQAQLDTSTLPTMDNAKFAKFCKDCYIIDGRRVTSIDVDILFNKAKEKGARRLDWNAFQIAFAHLAVKKYGNEKTEKEVVVLLMKWVLDKKPQVRATSTSSVGIFERLTDSTRYTGTHKHRFDEQGKGRGLMGRDRPSLTASLDKIVDRSREGGNTYTKPAFR